MPDAKVLDRLEAEHLIERGEAGWRSTRRWRAAMVRASARLYRQGVPWVDLRLPIAAALVELRGDLADGEIAQQVDALAQLEEAELSRALGARPE